jgi:hypothetical protein
VGDLGDGSHQSDAKYPVVVKGLVGAVSLASTSGIVDDYCAVLENGTAKCWGSNGAETGYPPGELGNGSNSPYSKVPTLVKDLTGVASVVTYGEGYCALLHDGGVECWGLNEILIPSGAIGVLGDGGRETHSNVPVRVVGLGPNGKVV